MNLKQRLFIICIAAIALLAGYGLNHFLTQSTTNNKPIEASSTQPDFALVGQTRPDFELPDIQGQQQHINNWNGKILLINFWATWCAPCRNEIPHFIQLQSQYPDDLQIIGIAIDQLDAVKEFSQAVGINYPVLYGQQNASEIGKAYGNRLGALPYSVFVDRQGNIQHIHYQGELSKSSAETLLKKLL